MKQTNKEKKNIKIPFLMQNERESNLQYCT